MKFFKKFSLKSKLNLLFAIEMRTETKKMKNNFVERSESILGSMVELFGLERRLE